MRVDQGFNPVVDRGDPAKVPDWVWEKTAPEDWCLTPDIGSRDDPGLTRAARRARNPEIWNFKVTAEMLENWPRAPVDVQAAFEDVFGRDRLFENGDTEGRPLMVVVHNPYLQREQVLGWDGKAGIYRNVSVAENDDAEPGFLAPDYVPFPEKHHFQGWYGTFRHFHRRDFEIIENFDAQKYTPTQIDAMMAEREEQIERDAECVMEAIEHQMVEYFFNAQVDAANERAGTGSRMRSMETPRIAQSPGRYKIDKVEQGDGKFYWRRQRHDGTDRKLELVETIKRWHFDYCREYGPEYEAALVAATELADIIREERKARHAKVLSRPSEILGEAAPDPKTEAVAKRLMRRLATREM